MKNDFILNGFSETYNRIYLNANVKYVDITAGDSISVTLNNRGNIGTFKVAQIYRNIDNAQIVLEDYPKGYNAFFSNQIIPIAAEDQKGTITIVNKTNLRPKFWQYYNEWITPIYTSIYTNVVSEGGKTKFILPRGINFPANIYAEILSSTGKYSGIYLPSNRSEWAGVDGYMEVYFDFPFNGDDSGVLVYTETPYAGPPVGDKPYIDTTQTVQTVVNPTTTPVIVTSWDSSGNATTQTVAGGATVVLANQPEKTPEPPFIVDPITPITTQNQLKSATMVLDMSLVWSMISKKMNEIKADNAFITLIRNNYKKGSLGYTQTIATNAIKELKEAGDLPLMWQVPSDWDGEPIWGQKEWVKNSFPYDEYSETVTSSKPPVVETTNPNPGATPTTNPNPGNTTEIPASTNTQQTATTTAQQTSETVKNAVTSVATEVEKEGINPIIKLILVVLGIVVIVKLIKK